MLHRLGALTKPDRYESVVRFIGGFFHQGVIDSQGSNIVDALGDAFFCEASRTVRREHGVSVKTRGGADLSSQVGRKTCR